MISVKDYLDMSINGKYSILIFLIYDFMYEVFIVIEIGFLLF